MDLFRQDEEGDLFQAMNELDDLAPHNDLDVQPHHHHGHDDLGVKEEEEQEQEQELLAQPHGGMFGSSPFKPPLVLATPPTAPSLALHADPHADRKHRIEELLFEFTRHTQERLAKIEDSIHQLTTFVSANPSLAAAAVGGLGVGIGGDVAVPTAPTAPNSAPFPPASVLPAAAAPLLKIGEIEAKWFTKRPYPSFVVNLVNDDGSPFVSTQNWQVAIRLVSGHGMFVDHFLNAPSLVFPVTDGKATITGVKFTAVTSRNGGYFQFEVAVTHPTNSNITPVRSPEFRVLSERLKNENKASSMLDLSASSALARVPGIGKKYAQRFAQAGLTTVRDLAALDASPNRRQLINMVRKDRGALTESRLLELLREAQEVVSRTEAEDAAAVAANNNAADDDEDDDDGSSSGRSRGHKKRPLGGDVEFPSVMKRAKVEELSSLSPSPSSAPSSPAMSPSFADVDQMIELPDFGSVLDA